MKYKLLLITLVFVLLILNVFAHEELEVKNKINPDSRFYGLDLSLEKTRLFFIIDKDKRADYLIERINERLIETDEMVKHNKLKFAEQSELRRQETQKELEAELQNLSKEKQKDIESKLTKHIIVLQEVISKAPEQAQKKGLSRALNSSSKVLERIRQR